ncbi:MAG TPA: acetolactate synthase large subunit, partial [Acetobacteraceae bacterium]|nr:acetolactate synthase large subunit [Acetobacteraceae bacterium]
MNGAESLLRTFVGSGIEVCFGNPGTSEMHFVAALDRVEGMRVVLGLFEGVVTGMADGYGRMAEKPAATLLHLGPGLANGLANLHNARRAATPIVNVVGDHATYHAQYDAPLASDVRGFARPVSGWVHSSASAQTVAADGARAVQAALQYPGQIATLILPADTAWLQADRPAPALPKPMPAIATAEAIEQSAGALRSGRKTMILIRGAALKERGLEAAGRLAAATGARIACDTFAPRCQRGFGRVEVERIPYFAEEIVEFMRGTKQLILVGASPPVSFFAYPSKPSWCTPEDCKILYLAHPNEDGTVALEALTEAVKAPKHPRLVGAASKPDIPNGSLNPLTAGQVIAHYLPSGAIISDEGATAGGGVHRFAANIEPHDHLALAGGAIGQGIPVATGAAIACPERKVVCLHGDGGAMYTLQALWTQAREALDVTTLIFANRSYAILNIELARVGAGDPGPKAFSMLD